MSGSENTVCKARWTRRMPQIARRLGPFIAFAAVCALTPQHAHSRNAAGKYMTLSCPGISVTVTAASPEEQGLVCAAAGESLHMLGRCEISLHRPLRIEIAGIVRNPFGNEIFGRFDNRQDVVFVTQLANVPSLAEGTPYGDLPPAAFYRSLVVHEVIHAVMHQNYRRQPTSRAAHEYPAYAIQLASLPADAREKFLRRFDDPGKTGLLFNDIILAFDPFFFAARAYEHFTASQNGCSSLLALLEGEVDFIVTLP